MLPPGFIAYIMYNFVKKRVNKRYVFVSYLGFAALCWLSMGVLLGGLMIGYNSLFNKMSITVIVRFMTIIPIPLVVIGEIYALVCWILWLRKEE